MIVIESLQHCGLSRQLGKDDRGIHSETADLEFFYYRNNKKVLSRAHSVNKELIKAIQRELIKLKKISKKVKKIVKTSTQILLNQPQKVIEQRAAIMGTNIHVMIVSDDQKQAEKGIKAVLKR